MILKIDYLNGDLEFIEVNYINVPDEGVTIFYGREYYGDVRKTLSLDGVEKVSLSDYGRLYHHLDEERKEKLKELLERGEIPF